MSFNRRSCFLFFLIIIVFAAGARPALCGDATVLIYHRFDEQRYPTTNVTMERFREQLAYLRDNDYHVIPLAELVENLENGRPLPAKSVVITIDDGYKSVYHKAWPILKSFGFPFTVFLYVKATENKHWDYMTWEQVRELEKAGVDFQDHGYGHGRLANQPAAMSDKEYRDWLRSDMVKSRTLLAERLGKEPRVYSIPYGEYNRTVITVAKELGYGAAMTQDPGSVSDRTDPFLIPREPILGNDWATMEHFRDILQRVDLPLTGREPDIEKISGNDPPARFAARLLFPERYLPETIGIYVSELGWRQAAVRNDVVSIENSSKLKRRLNRVAVSAREKTGRTAIRFWLLVNQDIVPDK